MSPLQRGYGDQQVQKVNYHSHGPGGSQAAGELSKRPKAQGLINTPDILLAQSNAFNITAHKLVQGNGRLKIANTELNTANTKLTQDSDRFKKTNAELVTRAKTAIQAKAKCEQDGTQAKQDSESRSSFLAARWIVKAVAPPEGH